MSWTTSWMIWMRSRCKSLGTKYGTSNNVKSRLITIGRYRMPRRVCYALSVFMICTFANAQESGKQKGNKPPAKFNWVSPLPEARLKGLPDGLRHRQFHSQSMGIDVGYYIYLPPGYDSAENASTRYPVVYHLHGGRPGSESKSVKLATFVDQAIRDGKIQPTIYVWPNGGPLSWYNYPQKENGQGEDVFIKETIPHIDATYRTIAKREGRGLQGFSQGGRGTTRIMFKYPNLFGTVAPGGSGYGPEQRIQENDGAESENVVFAKGYNTWDLAKVYADRSDAPSLKIMIWVGTAGFNYEFNLKFMEYLDELGIPYEKLISPDSPHSAIDIYQKRGMDLMKFHDHNLLHQ